jgi:hypothetical protein
MSNVIKQNDKLIQINCVNIVPLHKNNLHMKILVRANKSISQFRKEFQSLFPFLKVEFFTTQHNEGESSRKEDIVEDTTLLGKLTHKEGEVDIDPQISTAEFEKLLMHEFALNAQIFRKSGSVWIETSRTDDWTLAFQNEEGRKSTEPIQEEKADLSDRDKWE